MGRVITNIQIEDAINALNVLADSIETQTDRRVHLRAYKSVCVDFTRLQMAADRVKYAMQGNDLNNLDSVKSMPIVN